MKQCDTCWIPEGQLRLYGYDATPCGGYRPSDSFSSRSECLDYAEWASTRFMVASSRVLSGDTGMAALASASDMVRWRPEEYRRKVDPARRAPAYVLILDLT